MYWSYGRAENVLMQGKSLLGFRSKGYRIAVLYAFEGVPIELFSLDFFFRFIFVKLGVIDVMP